MRVEVLQSKVHRARITGKDVNYEGSLTLDPELDLERAPGPVSVRGPTLALVREAAHARDSRRRPAPGGQRQSRAGWPGVWQRRQTRRLRASRVTQRMEPAKPGPWGFASRPGVAAEVVAWQARQASSV